MERKQELNRVGKLLRAAIEHDRRKMKEYGSMTTLERIARLRARERHLRIVAKAHHEAQAEPVKPHPIITPPADIPPRVDSLRRAIRTITKFFNRGNR